MINQIKEIPFIRILIPWLCGICASRIFPALQNHIPVYVLLVSILLFIVLSIISRYIVFRSIVYLQSPLLLLILMILSFLSYRQAISFHFLPEEKAYYAGIVCSKPITKVRSVCVDVRLIGYGDMNSHKSVRDRVRIYIEKDTISKWPAIGDSVFFHARMSRITNNGNPEEFDYARYMMYRRIFYTGFLRKKDLLIGHNSEKYKMRKATARMRNIIPEMYKKYGIEGNALAVLTALTTGDREYLDEDLKNQYIDAGVMHVLAVSGLHVGILYLFLSFILLRRNQQRSIRIVRTIILILCIWFYAFMTGLSSSVIRASVMFTLFSLGFVMSRQTNGYNILCASALLTLIADPLELFRTGFQLSYLAVWGLLFWQPRLAKLYFFKNIIADRLWQLFTLSFAAQLATFPLSLFYFHKFPAWFWLSNMVVIPGIWLVMVTAILFFLISPFGLPASWVAFALKNILYCLNGFIKLVGLLPFATLDGIRFEPYHLIVFYLFIAGISAAWYRASLKTACLFILALLCCLIAGRVLFNTKCHKKEIIVYNFYKTPAISLINNREHILIMGTRTADDSVYTMTRMRDFMIMRGFCKSTHIIPLFQDSCNNRSSGREFSCMKNSEDGIMIRFSGIDLLYLVSVKGYKYCKNQEVKETCYLLIGKESGYPGCWNFQKKKPLKIIICESLPWKQQQMWKQFAAENRIIYYDVTCNGALFFRIP